MREENRKLKALSGRSEGCSERVNLRGWGAAGAAQVCNGRVRAWLLGCSAPEERQAAVRRRAESHTKQIEARSSCAVEAFTATHLFKRAAGH